MKQYEAVILTLERLGGQATLADLYREVMTVENCTWQTKTPFASIRRIVQVRPEIFKVQPGLWALRSYKSRLGLTEYGEDSKPTAKAIELTHAYYQGLLVVLGNLRGFSTFVPNQDRNKKFVDRSLGAIRSLQTLPAFSHPPLLTRASTVDVIWFNDRQMPNSLFEVEHSTDIQNSLVKFCELQDFYTRMVIVADANRRAEFNDKITRQAVSAVKQRVNFLEYETLVQQYEAEMKKASFDFAV